MDRITALPLALALALASGQALAEGAKPASAPSKAELSTVLRSEILTRKGSSFDTMIRDWERRYGTRAVAPLLRIAADRKSSDADRYVALMGAAKLGGREAAPALRPFLKDKSWMLRSGALRALAALGNPETGADVIPLLKDPALVVRTEAVEAVRKLRPAGSVEALVSSLEHSSNYHAGRAQWVPQKALEALVSLGAREVVHRLRPLLHHAKDPDLQKRAVDAIEKLTGRALKQGAPLADRIQAWDAELSRPRS